MEAKRYRTESGVSGGVSFQNAEEHSQPAALYAGCGDLCLQFEQFRRCRRPVSRRICRDYRAAAEYWAVFCRVGDPIYGVVSAPEFNPDLYRHPLSGQAVYLFLCLRDCGEQYSDRPDSKRRHYIRYPAR